jgi:CRP/FNR family cyclic AMP-dependent transcriptional regulator
MRLKRRTQKSKVWRTPQGQTQLYIDAMNDSSTPPSSLLDGLAPDCLRTLALQGQVRHYRKNTLLIQEGDVGTQMYVVLNGSLREFAMSQDSKPREITLSMAGRGELLGLLALEGGAHCSSVITLGPAVCAVVSAESVRVLLQYDPRLAMALLQRALQRLRLATQTTCLALFSDAYSRLSALLQRQHASVIAQAPNPAPMTHAQMAQHIGCSREMVSRIMKELIQGGYVVREPDRQYRVCRRLPMRW